ncbi:MAG: hypothetical protein A3J07_02270 [Candidatus Doudnabacteria bacterium RIFCSPLOWO2_02_FULL_49_13]|uniref:Transcriptional repressor PaaX-like central Cas2-like domain-containing protein n=1 Tax=Candidatus Doudnabacteria bacterium RIFCSPHIGHO2_12_FULL_48_16 TaxID=1817838 RepID=A0A1F5PLK8_9BACT|nr:MAG: hypothetical protein A3B77_00445 [Candidatus Doudnabacteria bacterium RIFCSPHIGHO2_02_FULL_49_24]OGE89220.1 MAG: hypothetical protein A2760_02740 [Candidatus Doudnabacteria bacterium RIFCSPHIGHO2_01_FULL_50_67]OGE90757.1 MAG: hypothetical protein A3E29_01370 [Candidatus Doudnabacteria bacterium RIFCSPHIGHO2_12_FULL_48_16]OGE97668.1 MAG: hypothetical protein A2990_02620 [Candidatus Doudnabacteria bacterium RIFCSPLOWO2_01_FULL_49_40]OGF02620.1 MAG: hypothetical protein A3J07_02270 [Candid
MLALLAGFIIPAALFSPFAGYALIRGTTHHYFKKRDFNRELARLKKRNYIALTKTDKGWLIQLLAKGRIRAKQVAFENIKLPKAKVWDGRWRLFSFDIPEEYKNARNMLRFKLKSLGCFNIQRSLFAYPYDCKRELQAIVQHYKVEKFTMFAETSYIDLDKELRKFFNL